MNPMTFKTATILCLLCFFVALISLAQGPTIEGNWYGSINPPGANFDIAVHFEKKGEIWTGALLVENGERFPLREIVAQLPAISFSFDPGGEKITLKGSLSGDATEISGQFTQNNSVFPFKLSRMPRGPLKDAAIAIDPNELIAMMSSFSGPPSERPFVPPLDHQAIGYGVRASRDPVANLMKDVEAGKVRLKFEGEDGYLDSLLNTLHIPKESQLAVFSKNSLQSAIISPENPRRLFFNDSVAVGWVRGGFIELASQDPELGTNFYVLFQDPAEKPFFMTRGDCLRCHLSRNSMDIPGMLMRSVYPSADGTPINPLGSYLLDHRTKFEERWGGWYVTGNTGSIRHLGNSVVSNPAMPESMTTLKDKATSDIVALMVFEHQMHMMNLITRVGWEFRIAASLEQSTGKRNEVIDRQLHDATNELVEYVLFLNEAPLTSKIGGTSGFAEKFAAEGPKDSKGRSLRQFDLEHRLMRYPCSYMIYSPTFEALPPDAKKAIYTRMREVMAQRLSAADRAALTEILRDTKKDF